MRELACVAASRFTAGPAAPSPQRSLRARLRSPLPFRRSLAAACPRWCAGIPRPRRIAIALAA
eukprot:1952524-Pleurochrysis_carterae.AAC.1